MFAFATLLDEILARGEQACVIEIHGDGLRTHTSAAIPGRARELAVGLVAAGMTPGATVGLFADNGADWITARLAIMAGGGVAVTIDHQADAREAEAIIRDAKPRLLLAGQAQAAVLAGADVPVELTTYVIDRVEEDVTEPAPSSWRRLFAQSASSSLPKLDSEARAMLVYTSGTTGSPKAFALRNRHLEAIVRAIAGFGLLGPSDRMLLPLPLHHVYPFVVGVLVPLAVGAAVVLPQAATGPKILDALVAGEATAMIGVPRLYEALVAGLDSQARARGRLAYRAFKGLLALSIAARRRWGLRLGRRLFPQVHARLGPRLRILVSAGAKLDEGPLWTLEGLGYLALAGYGLAETASAFTGNVPGAQRIGTEGRPLLADGRIRIAKPNAEGTGEIELFGSNVFDGYIDNPEANAHAFTADGWFRTGDLGRLDPDGFLFVSGRSKELIVLGGGKNIFPDDLEKHYGADPAIREIAVLEDGGRLVALVVPDMAAIHASANTRVEDVIRVALASGAQSLPSHERLSGYALVREPLPRTRLGKYQRFRLPDLYRKAMSGGGSPPPAALSAEDEALLQEPRAAAAWALLQTRYAGRGLSLDADPQLDLGIDSLEWLSLGLELESALGIRLSEQNFAEVTVVRDLLRTISAHPAGPSEAETARAMAAVEADAARWLAPQTRGERIAATLIWALDRLLGRVFFRLRVEGRAPLASQAPYIIVCNHVSDLDAPLVAAALPLATVRSVYWAGDRSRLFYSSFSRWFCRVANIFPVDEQAPGATLAMAGRVLQAGRALIWFPESWRSPDGELQRFLPGIGRLLADHPVPIIPAHIRGAFEAMPRGRRLPRPHPVTITFGEPIEPAALQAMGEGETPVLRLTDAVRNSVARLATGG